MTSRPKKFSQWPKSNDSNASVALSTHDWRFQAVVYQRTPSSKKHERRQCNAIMAFGNSMLLVHLHQSRLFEASMSASRVQTGEMVAIMGPSGCGKDHPAQRVVWDRRSPQQGHVTVNDQPLFGITDNQRTSMRSNVPRVHIPRLQPPASPLRRRKRRTCRSSSSAYASRMRPARGRNKP